MGKIANVASLIKDFGSYTVFIETGTQYGDGVDWALSQNFKIIYSFEIDSKLINELRNKYKSYPNVFIMDARTTTFKNIPNFTIMHKILFWLDAHYPSDDFTHANPPLNKELQQIADMRQSQYVWDLIICDDLRIFEEGPYEQGNLPNWAARAKYDLQFVPVLFPNKNIIRLYKDEGYLIIE